MTQEQKKIKNNKPVYIYCMGAYGIETYLKLKEYGIKIDGFADGNIQKKGYALDGICCMSYEELLCEDKECFLIVAKKNPEPLIRQFKRAGFRNVRDKETGIERLTAGWKSELPKVKPLMDIEVIKAVKESIQETVYGQREDIGRDLPNRNMLADYWLRHPK